MGLWNWSIYFHVGVLSSPYRHIYLGIPMLKILALFSANIFFLSSLLVPVIHSYFSVSITFIQREDNRLQCAIIENQFIPNNNTKQVVTHVVVVLTTIGWDFLGWYELWSMNSIVKSGLWMKCLMKRTMNEVCDEKNRLFYMNRMKRTKFRAKLPHHATLL